ncbi:MAG TPA: diguanylate cyclase, partial [Phycisphaerales bacterium]|nr:diguanylate cyclase [Phycisphaerales bacterium]
LTGLSNRRWLNLMLEGRWAEAQRHDLSMAFIMIDLDGFKQLNDRLGHQRGDDLLRVVGEVIERNCREIDVAARYGGDEFCILMPHTDLDAAMHVADRISNAFMDRIAGLDLHAVTVGLSIGVGHRDLSNPGSAEDLVRHADEAMYAAKAACDGANRVFVRARGGAMVSSAA